MGRSFFGFQSDTRNRNLWASTKINKNWFDRKEVAIVNMEAFKKALKKTDPGEQLITICENTKKNTITTPGAVWIPSLFNKDALTIKRSVPAVWKLWWYAAKTTSQPK